MKNPAATGAITLIGTQTDAHAVVQLSMLEIRQQFVRILSGQQSAMILSSCTRYRADRSPSSMSARAVESSAIILTARMGFNTGSVRTVGMWCEGMPEQIDRAYTLLDATYRLMKKANDSPLVLDIYDVLKQVGMAENAYKMPYQLSGGEYIDLALADSPWVSLDL